MSIIMQRLKTSYIAFACASLLALAGCGLGGPAYRPGSDAAAVVDMSNALTFKPNVVHIKAGAAVEWRNRSYYTHTVTDDPARAEQRADAQLPDKATSFSARVGPGQVYRHVFTVPGRYRYFCIPHEAFDMRGEVVVEPAG